MAINRSEIDIFNKFDFQKSNMWDFTIINNVTNLSTGASLLSLANDIGIKFKVRSATLPFEKLKTETRPTGDKYYFEFEPIETVTIEIYETTAFNTFRYFNTWKESIYSTLTRTFNVGNHDRIGILKYFAYDQSTPTQIFIYHGLKFLGIEDVENAYESGDPLIYSVTFTCDEIKSVIP